VINPDQNKDAANTWFLGNMFMDRYFIINDYELHTSSKTGTAKLGIYDKWHPINGNWKPEGTPDRRAPLLPDGKHHEGDSGVINPVVVDPTEETKSGNEDEEGSSAFGVIFGIGITIMVIGAIIYFGKQYLEKKSGTYDAYDTDGAVMYSN